VGGGAGFWPTPYKVSFPTGTPIFSIDVECIATSKLHNARSVAHLALVDEWCQPVCSIYVKQELPVASYMTVRPPLCITPSVAPSPCPRVVVACFQCFTPTPSHVLPSIPLRPHTTPQPVTGLTEQLIAEHGIPLADALIRLRACLPASAGQCQCQCLTPLP